MKIVRAKRHKNFTIMANKVIYDARISYRALGLLTFLLSKPDGWETDSDRLSEGRKEGRDAIRTAMKELRESGYLKHVRVQDPTTGRWSTVAELTDQPEDGFPVPGVTRENTMSSQVGPTTGKPTVGYPAVGKPGPIPRTDTKDGDQGLEAGGTLPPDPLRTEHAPRTRTDPPTAPNLVVHSNGTKQVTSRTRVHVQHPLLAALPPEPDFEPVEEHRLEIEVEIPARIRDEVLPALGAQLARIERNRQPGPPPTTAGAAS